MQWIHCLALYCILHFAVCSPTSVTNYLNSQYHSFQWQVMHSFRAGVKMHIMYLLRTRFKSCYSVSFTVWARCNSNGRHTELIGVVWVKTWNVARYWSAVLLKGLPHMWVNCSYIDDVVDNDPILFIRPWRIPWELHSHGVNRYSSSDPWRAGWNCEIMYKS